MNEIGLIDSLKRGNEHVFAILVNKYKNLVFSICLQICVDYQLAEEAAQDSFLKAYKSIHRFQYRSKFSTWLYKIAVNTSYNKIRTKKPTESIDNIEIVSIDLENGFEKLNQEDKRKCIEQAFSEMDRLDALVLNLFYIEELSIAELAEIIDLSSSNIKVKLFRARKKMNTIIVKLMKNELDSIL